MMLQNELFLPHFFNLVEAHRNLRVQTLNQGLKLFTFIQHLFSEPKTYTFCFSKLSKKVLKREIAHLPKHCIKTVFCFFVIGEKGWIVEFEVLVTWDVGSINCFKYWRILAICKCQHHKDVFGNIISKYRKDWVEDIFLRWSETCKGSLCNESNSIEVVDAIWWGNGEELLYLTSNELIPLQTFCITKPWRINYRKCVRYSWTFQRIKRVRGDVLRLTVSLRYAFVLHDEFVSVVVLPLHTQHVIHHTIDQRWLTSSSSSHYHENFLNKPSLNSFRGLPDTLSGNHAVSSSHSHDPRENVNRWRWRATFHLLWGGEKKFSRFVRNRNFLGFTRWSFIILWSNTLPFLVRVVGRIFFTVSADHFTILRPIVIILGFGGQRILSSIRIAFLSIWGWCTLLFVEVVWFGESRGIFSNDTVTCVT